jgi:hypothetical protein
MNLQPRQFPDAPPRRYSSPPLIVYVHGATKGELARGKAAAEAMFAEAGCTAYEAALAYWKLEGIEFGGAEELTEKEDRIAALWLKAADRAAEVICKGWRRPADSAEFGLGVSVKELRRVYDKHIQDRGFPLPER